MALQEGIEVFRFFSVEVLTESNDFIGAFWFRFDFRGFSVLFCRSLSRKQ